MAGEMKVASRELAGQMIIKLATGELEIPSNTDDARALLAEYGISMDGYEEIEFVVDTDTKKHFIVPAKAVIDAAQERVDQAQNYHKMTDEHFRMYNGRFSPMVAPDDRPTKQEFFDFRVGDYSSSHCA